MLLRKYQKKELKKILQSQISEFFYIRENNRIKKTQLKIDNTSCLLNDTD